MKNHTDGITGRRHRTASTVRRTDVFAVRALIFTCAVRPPQMKEGEKEKKKRKKTEAIGEEHKRKRRRMRTNTAYTVRQTDEFEARPLYLQVPYARSN